MNFKYLIFVLIVVPSTIALIIYHNNVSSSLLLLVVILPILSAVILPLFHRYENIREMVSLTFATLNLLLALLIAYIHFGGLFAFYGMDSVMGDGMSGIMRLWAPIVGHSAFSFALSTENLGVIFAIMVNFLWIISIIYSSGYLRSHHEKNQTRFFAFFAIAIACTLGVAFSSNLFTIFLFYELLTLSTFPLVAHNLTGKNRRSVYTYLSILVVASLTLFLLGVILVNVVVGTTDFRSGGIFGNTMVKGEVSPYFVIMILLLFIFGIAKAAVMPLHKWLPSAMVAPTPVSALLHAVAVVKSGVFALLKIVIFIFGIDTLSDIMETIASFNWLLIIPSFTIIMASIIALFQDNLKKRLAYSTIAQLSYIVLGALIFTQNAVLGASLHIFAHAFGKITLFFAAGSIIVLSHKENVSELSGIGKRMPITMIAFTLAALSMVGFPLTFGFISKWFLIMGILDAEAYWVLFVIIISTLLNAMYFFPIIFKAFFEDEVVKKIHKEKVVLEHTSVGHTSVGHTTVGVVYPKSKGMDTALIITSVMIVALNIYSAFFINLLTLR